MSTVERISQLSHRIFNTSLNEKQVARSSNLNPFVASNFQKNILTEDVYESSSKKDKNVSFQGNLMNSGSKRIYSTFVGSISNFGSRLAAGIESIIAFGRRMKDNVVNTWRAISEIGNTEVTMDGVKNLLNKEIGSFDGVRNILNKEVGSFDGIKDALTKERSMEDVKYVLTADIKDIFGKSKDREISRLSKMDPLEVKPMLANAIHALENDMVMVA